MEDARVIQGAPPDVLPCAAGVSADLARDDGIRPVGLGFADQPGAAAFSPCQRVGAVEMLRDDSADAGIASSGRLELESSRAPRPRQ
jgi:hypothetical protein